MPKVHNDVPTHLRLADKLHHDCVVCGANDPLGLGLEFQPGADGTMTLIFNPQYFQGYNDRLHGGIISLLFDTAMTHCIFSLGITAVTGSLNLRFLHPVQTSKPVYIKAQIEKMRLPLFVLSGRLLQRNLQLVTATGKFMKS